MNILANIEQLPLIHMAMTTPRIPPRYGVEADKEPKVPIKICCKKDPPDLPKGLPMTSTAALPLVFDSESNGMYAISLHGSNNEYFAPFERMFCAAPINTASIRGVVPSWAVMGAKNSGNSVNEKNAAPVVSRVTGVINAATKSQKKKIYDKVNNKIYKERREIFMSVIMIVFFILKS